MEFSEDSPRSTESDEEFTEVPSSITSAGLFVSSINPVFQSPKFSSDIAIRDTDYLSSKMDENLGNSNLVHVDTGEVDGGVTARDLRNSANTSTGESSAENENVIDVMNGFILKENSNFGNKGLEETTDDTQLLSKSNTGDGENNCHVNIAFDIIEENDSHNQNIHKRKGVSVSSEKESLPARGNESAVDDIVCALESESVSKQITTIQASESPYGGTGKTDSVSKLNSVSVTSDYGSVTTESYGSTETRSSQDTSKEISRNLERDHKSCAEKSNESHRKQALQESLDFYYGPLFSDRAFVEVKRPNQLNQNRLNANKKYSDERLRQRKNKFSETAEGKPIKHQVPHTKHDKKTKQKGIHITRDITQAVFVRLLLAAHSFVCVWRAVDVWKNDHYWLLILTNLVLLVETIYTTIWRHGQDPKWICPCFVIYLTGTVPAIWLLQIDKLNRYSTINNTTSVANTTAVEALSAIQGVQIPIYLDADAWVSVLEQILLFVLVIGRMILPLGKLRREELSQILFIFIGSGSDVIELFVVFDEPKFRSNEQLKYATLVIWSVSLLQFTFVLTSARSPKKARLGTMNNELDNVREKRTAFGIEIWSLMISFVFMDGPYCCLRLYAIIEHNVFSYGIIFFTCKNILMLILLFYRMFIVCIKYRNRGKEKKAVSKLQPRRKLIA